MRLSSEIISHKISDFSQLFTEEFFGQGCQFCFLRIWMKLLASVRKREYVLSLLAMSVENVNIVKEHHCFRD